METSCDTKMADIQVESYGPVGNNVFSGTPSPLPRPYLPSLPPEKTIKPSYSRFLIEAPFSALAGVVADARDPPKPPMLPRSRNRIQVGCTNRWRLPNILGSDLLGSSQALKSVTSSYNDTIKAVMTELGGERLYRSAIHSLISPRFLKSQPTPGLNSTKEFDRRLIRSQPTSYAGSTRNTNGHGGLSSFHLQQIDYQRNVIPPAMRSPTPMELFLCRSQTAGLHKVPDVIVYALETTWELHKPYLQKSSLLSSLLKKAEMTGMRNIEEKAEDEALNPGETVESNLDALITAASLANMDPSAVTSDMSVGRRRSSTFALALSALYESEIEMNVSEADVVGVLAAATFLGFTALEKLCADVMLRSIAAWSVCAFHAAAFKAFHMERVFFIQDVGLLDLSSATPQLAGLLDWLVSQKLQGGGDMSLMTRFEHGALRKGFILEEHLKYHSEIMSLHGFHFEIKAVKDESNSKYSFFLQVRYCIRVQWLDSGVNKVFSTGILCQSFGFSGKAKQSEVVTVEDVRMPLFVTVSLMFPPS
ncbi:BTB/POZ domain-containing protein 16 [Stylophora pistillata]|uniref:BTB/POZ domain-containing protein 16 n=1 Tax=Stylophora pistillata TaxID=50429 RepID=A0A2B4SMF6_STYPI|nr:BTB/POZ domain-containing protein 16 [Stylophora pistillata]